MISGLIVRLRQEPIEAQAACDAIRCHREFQVGDRIGDNLPAVLEAKDPAQSQDLTDWLLALPGIAHVDVVSVNFEETAEISTKEHFNVNQRF